MKFTIIKHDTKKNQILEATFKCIYEKGARATTMRSIAKRANVSQALLHYHFKNKENLLSEFIQIVLDNLVDSLGKSLSPSDTPKKKLDIYFNYGRNYAEKKGDIVLVVQEIWAISIRDAKLKKVFSDHIKKMSSLLESILAKGEKEGVFNKVSKDCYTFHRTYFAFVVGMGILLQVDRSSSSKAFDFIEKDLKKIILKTS